jgi:alpha-beta hydrolase superfamily lysophospholipase
MAVHHGYGPTNPSAEFRLTSKDGLRVACARWDSRGPVLGVLQIAHGMGEHIGRYTTLIEVLIEAGLSVYGNDHRGHGRTAASAKQFGEFGEGGFDLLVDDMIRLGRIAREENRNKPFILLGHSMGSFAAQLYVLDHSREVDGLALSGSGALDELARLASSSLPGENILNAPFEPARTPFDWLSRDSAVVDAFIHDPLCFATLKPEANSSFFAAADRLSDPVSLRKIRPDLSVYLFSGSRDPVGQQLEGVQVLIERYQKAGFHDISQDFYPGGRHEMLNEINRGQVRANLLRWISAVLENKKSGPETALVA